MKKVVYAIIACIILIGIILIATIGLKVDITYSKNVQIDIYVGKEINNKDIKAIVNEVFPNERVLIRKVELFDDMVSVTMKDKSDEELKDKIEQLNAKINEKYGTENTVDEDIAVIHNPKHKLIDIVKPYILPVAISMVIILIYVVVRYRKLGVWKSIGSYVLHSLLVEGLYVSIIAITRIPVNRLFVPIALALYVGTVTTLTFKNEDKLLKMIQSENKKNK